MAALEGMKIAIVVADGFEQAELLEPREALEDAGAETSIIAPERGKVQGFRHLEKGDTVAVDMSLEEADPADFDALLLPGGIANPDRLRIEPRAVAFVRAFFDEGKPVAAICHGPWTLIEAGVLEGRTVTSWPSLRTDLSNAGASWVDEEVVVDGDLVTSRKPADIPAFNRAMVEAFAETPVAEGDAAPAKPMRGRAPPPSA